MGKKGIWISAIKRVFTPLCKGKLTNESDKKSTKEKKRRGLRKLRRGETNTFIPLFREPSSIEKILGDAEREHKLVFRPPTPPEQPKTPPFVAQRVASPRVPSQRITSPRVASPRAASPRAASPRAASPRAASPRAASPRAASPRAASPREASPRAASPKAASPRAASPRAASPRAASPRAASPRAASPRAASPRAASPRIVQQHGERSEPTLGYHHASATKIQAAYRGYMARRSFRALKGLVRLQGVVKGQNVKRQTTSAMKYMQLLVRVQSQIQSRRMQTLENQARCQAQYKKDKDTESTLGKWTFSQASDTGNDEDWDASVLTKEEMEARLQRKVEAVIKRERSKAYSHQLRKSTPKSAQTSVADLRFGGFPRWWNWLERQLPAASTPETPSMKNFHLTPPRPIKASPLAQSSNHKQHRFEFSNMDTPTPKSTKSSIPTTPRPARSPASIKIPRGSPSLSKYARARASGAASPFDLPLKDDDSLTSCPPFSVPNYMTPTFSAKAKVRANSNPKERFPGTPSSSESQRRLSFPMTRGTGSFKWNNNNNKGSLFSSASKDSKSPRVLDKNQSLHSIGNLSVDSTVSMPAAVGRKPFNRFV